MIPVSDEQMNFETYRGRSKGSLQAQYKAEVERQKKLLGIMSLYELVPVQDEKNDESDDVAWEDGFLKSFPSGQSVICIHD